MSLRPLLTARRGSGLGRRSGSLPLGAILRAQGAIGDAELARGLDAQKATGQRLGDVLVAEGVITRSDLAAALADQWDAEQADPDRRLPEPGLAQLRGVDAGFCLAHRLCPWRREGAAVVWITPEPVAGAAGLAALGPAASGDRLAVAALDAWERALVPAMGPALAARAAELVPAVESARSLGPMRRRAGVLLTLLVAALWVAPVAVGAALLVALFCLNAATTGLRVAALLLSAPHVPAPAAGPQAAEALSSLRPPPKVTVLVPLFREAGMVPRLLAALDRLDWPRPLLEVLLLVEEGDAATRAAIAAIRLPGWARAVVVPAGSPRTKPRAMNHALALATGEIVGIFDAEDRPDPAQIAAVADLLRNTPPQTACVQCELAWFNARENWLSRCFQIEYGIWFAVLLRGWQRLGLPVPLGGTSVWFRRSVLVDLGGWDAHNVTEDADLGMRLARAGFRTEVLPVVTEEEATCRVLPWIRQRSRWLKGYLMTWLCHMRDPGRLWRDLGPVGFAGLNLLFLGAAAAYLALPLFWVAVVEWTITGRSLWASAMPGWVIWPVGVSLALGQAVMLVSAVLAMRRRGSPWLALWVPTLPVYWSLGAIAAWKAVVELILAPYWWDKTRHGVTRMPPRE